MILKKGSIKGLNLTRIIQKIFEINDLSDHVALSKTEYSEADHNTVNESHLIWKFYDAPYQAVDSTLMMDGEVLVGRSMRHRRPFSIGGEDKALVGATIFDVLVAAKNRNALSIIQLIKKGSELSDVDLILHGSNPFSYPIYSRLLKYPVAFCLSARGLPIRLAAPLKKLFGFGPSFLNIFVLPLHLLVFSVATICGMIARLKFSNSPISTFEMDHIHEDFRSIAGPHFIRDFEFAKWRYKVGPVFNARLIKISKGSENLGYAAVKNVNFEGINLGLIIDLQLRRKLTLLEKLAFNFGIIVQLMKDKPDAIVMLANFSNPMLKNWIGFPFFTIPDKYLPHANPIFALMKNDKKSLMEKLSSTYFTLADLDYF